MNRALDKIITAGLLIVIVVTSLSHGAVEAWSILLFELLVVLLLSLWTWKAIASKRLAVSVPAAVWPLIALIAIGLGQSIAMMDEAGNRRSLSFDVEATRGAVMVLACLLACAMLAANFLTSRERLEKLSKFLTCYGLVLAVFAIIQYFTWNDRFYWFRINTGDTPFGPFVNRNHFAGYMELLLPWPAAMLLMRRSHRGEAALYLLAAAWMGAAVAISLSRGGMISLFAELMLIAALGGRVAGAETGNARSSRVRVLALRFGSVAAILITIIGGVLWLGAERVINRIATGQETEGPIVETRQTFSSSRGDLWRGSWEVFRAHPLTGVGLGAFETAYPIYSRDTGLDRVAAHAHNDYLQILADGGILGGALVLWFAVALWRGVSRGLQSRDPLLRAVTLACGASLFGLLVHSLFDFNLQLPSHALLFMAFAAIVCQVGAMAAQPLIPGEPEVIEGIVVRES